jgi:hypothetical protein
MLSGAYSGSPESKLVFFKSILTIPLSIFQQLFPDYNIYSFFLLAVVIVSYGLLLIPVKHIRNNYHKIYLTVIHFVGYSVLVPWYTLSPTYTSAAVFSGAIGLILLYYYLNSKAPNTKFYLIIVFLLIAVSISIRLESFLLSFVILAPTLAVVITLQKKVFIKKQIIIISLLAVFSIITILADDINYSSNEWKEYIEVNNLRHSIQLRTAEYALADNLNEMNWSQVDYEFFTRFSLADPDKLNTTNLSQAKQNTKDFRGLTGILNANPINEYKFIKNAFLPFDWILLIFLAILLLNLLTSNLRYYLPLLILGFIISASILYVLASNYHLPERIIFSMTVILFINSFFIVGISMNSSNVNPRITTITFLSAIVILASLIYINLPKELAARSNYNKQLHSIFTMQSNYFIENQQSIFIGTGAKIRESWQNPYAKYRKISSKENIFLLGWHNLSPLWYDEYTSMNFEESTIYGSIIDNERIYWIESSENYDIIKNFMSQYSKNDITVGYSSTIDDESYLKFEINN